MLNHFFSIGKIKITLVILLFTFSLFLFGSSLKAAPPDDGRPYLELPFPGDTQYRVTCGYSCYQHHGTMYYAVDFAIPEGDPIVAAAAGEVMAVTWEMGLPANLNLGDALILYLDHGNGWFTRYVHLDGVTVEVGDQVEMGDVIGYGGKTGASGDHLHFELKHGTSLHSASVPIDELFGGQEPKAGRRYVSNNWTLENRALANERLMTPSVTLVPSATPTLTPRATLSATPSPTALADEPVKEIEEVEEVEEVREIEAVEDIEEVVLWHKPQVQDPAEVVNQEHRAELPTATPSATATATPSATATAEPTVISAAPQVKEALYLLPRVENGLSLSVSSINAGEPITTTFTLHNATEERLHLNLLGVAGRPAGSLAPLEDMLFFDRLIVLNPGRRYDFEKTHAFEQAGEYELFVFALGEHNEWIPLDGMNQIAPLTVQSEANRLFLPMIMSGK